MNWPKGPNQRRDLLLGRLFDMKAARERKDYVTSDAIRKEVESVGHYWFMPEIVNTGNLWGHFKEGMQIKIRPDGNIEMQGSYIEWGRNGNYQDYLYDWDDSTMVTW